MWVHVLEISFKQNLICECDIMEYIFVIVFDFFFYVFAYVSI